MKKITSRQYAQALYESTREEKSVDEAVLKFAKMLFKKNKLKKAGEIIADFEKIWNKENGIVKADVVVARKIKPEMMEKVRDFIKKEYKAVGVDMDVRIDREIKGGVVIRIDDDLIDLSIKKRLDNLKEALI